MEPIDQALLLRIGVLVRNTRGDVVLAATPVSQAPQPAQPAQPPPPPESQSQEQPPDDYIPATEEPAFHPPPPDYTIVLAHMDVMEIGVREQFTKVHQQLDSLDSRFESHAEQSSQQSAAMMALLQCMEHHFFGGGSSSQ